MDITTLRMARKPVKSQKENPAGCAGEGVKTNKRREKDGSKITDNSIMWGRKCLKYSVD